LYEAGDWEPVAESATGPAEPEAQAKEPPGYGECFPFACASGSGRRFKKTQAGHSVRQCAGENEPHDKERESDQGKAKQEDEQQDGNEKEGPRSPSAGPIIVVIVFLSHVASMPGRTGGGKTSIGRWVPVPKKRE
jgi:hypothetical protein